MICPIAQGLLFLLQSGSDVYLPNQNLSNDRHGVVHISAERVLFHHLNQQTWLPFIFRIILNYARPCYACVTYKSHQQPSIQLAIYETGLFTYFSMLQVLSHKLIVTCIGIYSILILSKSKNKKLNLLFPNIYPRRFDPT